MFCIPFRKLPMQLHNSWCISLFFISFDRLNNAKDLIKPSIFFHCHYHFVTTLILLYAIHLLTITLKHFTLNAKLIIMYGWRDVVANDNKSTELRKISSQRIKVKKTLYFLFFFLLNFERKSLRRWYLYLLFCNKVLFCFKKHIIY